MRKSIANRPGGFSVIVPRHDSVTGLDPCACLLPAPLCAELIKSPVLFYTTLSPSSFFALSICGPADRL